MPFAKIKDLNMYYELHGPETGKSMVLINGLKSDHAGWAPMLNDLSKDYRVLVFDNRGVGQTKDNGEPFTVETMADDTMELIKHLGLEMPYVAGHSLGGAVAQMIAKKYPHDIDQVVLCNTFIKFNAEASEVFTKVLELYEKGATQADIMKSILPWVFSESFLTSELEQTILKMSNEDPNPQSEIGYRNQLIALKSFDSTDWVSSITVPTVIIGSTEDITATPEESKELKQRIPGAGLVLLPGAHASAVEQSKLFYEAIKEHCPCSPSLVCN